MPTINVSLKDGASSEDLDQAKKQITDQGGKITHEYKLVKGFTAEVPDDQISTLQANDKLDVEKDSKVTTQ